MNQTTTDVTTNNEPVTPVEVVEQTPAVSENEQAFREWQTKAAVETGEAPATNDDEEPKPTWSDVAAASAAAETVDEEVDFIEDKISVQLTDAEILSRDRANGQRLAERTQLETDLETKRAEAKAIKTEIDELQAELDSCIKETSSGRALVTKRWRVVSDFRLHEERWHDPDDGRLVDTRALPTNRRQVSLPFGNAAGSAAVKSDDDTTGDADPSSDDIDFDDSATDLDEGEGDSDDDRDSTPIAAVDPDDIEIDATEILEAAPPAPIVSVPPSKPSRRGRKKAE